MKHIITIVTVILSLTACGKSDPLKGQFISGCMQSSSKEVCGCIYDHIASKHSKEDTFNMLTNFEYYDQLQQAVADSQRSCLL